MSFLNVLHHKQSLITCFT